MLLLQNHQCRNYKITEKLSQKERERERETKKRHYGLALLGRKKNQATEKLSYSSYQTTLME